MSQRSAYAWTATGVLTVACRSFKKSPLRVLVQLGLPLVCWSVPQEWLQDRIWSATTRMSQPLLVRLARLLFDAAWSAPVLAGCLLVALQTVRDVRPTRSVLRIIPGRVVDVFVAAVITGVPYESYWIITTQLPRLGLRPGG